MSNIKKKNNKKKKKIILENKIEDKKDFVIDEEEVSINVDNTLIKKYGWVFAIIPIVVLIVASFFINNKLEDTGLLNYTILVDAEKSVYQIENERYVETETETNLVKIEVDNYGIMIAELYPDIAPITVENFKKLVSEKYYDDFIFHRVINNFMIQTGLQKNNGEYGKEVETIKGEFSDNGIDNDLSHTRGVLSMARRGSTPETDETYNSASNQFFIVHVDTPSLDGKYAAFGKVIHGLDVIDDVAKVSTDSNDKPISNQTILSIRFVSEYETAK